MVINGGCLSSLVIVYNSVALLIITNNKKQQEQQNNNNNVVVSKIFRTGAASWSKNDFDPFWLLLSSNRPFCMYTLVPGILLFFLIYLGYYVRESTLEVVFCEGVYHCLDHQKLCQTSGFSTWISSWGIVKKVMGIKSGK